MLDNEISDGPLEDAIDRIVDTMTDGHLKIGPRTSCGIDTRILFANFKFSDGTAGLCRMDRRRYKSSGKHGTPAQHDKRRVCEFTCS